MHLLAMLGSHTVQSMLQIQEQLGLRSTVASYSAPPGPLWFLSQAGLRAAFPVTTLTPSSQSLLHLLLLPQTLTLFLPGGI